MAGYPVWTTRTDAVPSRGLPADDPAHLWFDRAARLERLNEILNALVANARLKIELLELRLAMKDAKANFDPNQPRLPGGQRWSGGDDAPTRARPASQPILVADAGGDPVLLAQVARGGRAGSAYLVPTSGGALPATPGQAARYEVARLQANAEIAFVRRIDPDWRPTPDLTATVEGAIARQNAIVREAQRYVASITRTSPGGRRVGIGDNGGPPLDPLPPGTARTLAPGGVPSGLRLPRTDDKIYTLSPQEFDGLVASVTRGAVEMTAPSTYGGIWYELVDRCVIGLRMSKRSGLTIDVIRSSNETVLQNQTKFHFRSVR